MVKYKVNLLFKENGKSLNDTIISALKIKLEKHINNTYNNSKINTLLKSTNPLWSERDIY